MRFGGWYPLQDAGDLVPSGENVLQLRLAAGLIDYPRGKSAMVHYQHSRDAQAAAHALVSAYCNRAQPLVCRHLIEVDRSVDLAAFCAKLRSEFERRFGAAPKLP